MLEIAFFNLTRQHYNTKQFTSLLCVLGTGGDDFCL